MPNAGFRRSKKPEVIPDPDQHVFDIFTAERVKNEGRAGAAFALRLHDSKPWFVKEQVTANTFAAGQRRTAAPCVATCCTALPDPVRRRPRALGRA